MKPLLILGLLGSIGGAVLAVMIRTSLKDLRLEKDDANRQTESIHDEIRQQIAVIETTNETYRATAKNAKDEDLQVKSLANETKSKEKELQDIKAEVGRIAAERQAMQENITRILGSSGTPEEILAKNEELKKENDAKVEEIEQISKEAETAKRAASESQSLIGRLKAQQATRSRTINLASRTGTVTAVNGDLGFVIINLGQNQGVSSESRLLVKRGGQLIGKLNIVRIEGNTSVADIDFKSIARGQSIQPGDEVVFENSPS